MPNQIHQPKPGVDYVGISTPFYCHDGKGNFLLHKRSKNCRDEQGRWDPGSGELNFGLTIEENVLKEVQEEYGCKAVVQEQIPAHSIFRDHNDIYTHWVAIPSFVLVDPAEVKNGEPVHIDEIGWFRLDHLPSPLHHGFSFTYKIYKSYFQKYQK